ncbi:hypothetical protein EDD16DRAFT_1899137 [Pisolithus croceorrhizus]|nr:hypothetical protein EDD16DRAFT_1899137 [Pisolithus croceorrhizus]
MCPELANRRAQAKLSHELIAGAAAYEAAKAYENHKARNGEPSSHAQAKELLAGFAGAFIDREVGNQRLGLPRQTESQASRGGTSSQIRWLLIELYPVMHARLYDQTFK